MTIESLIGIVSGLITIGLFIPVVYNYVKKQSLTELMKHLVKKELSSEQHRKILKKMNRKLVGGHIKEDYIQGFVLNNRGKEAVFMDICEKNGIEPTKEVCVKFLGSDMPKFRAAFMCANNAPDTKPMPGISSVKQGNTVYMSELLKSRYPETCKNLTDILEKHDVPYAFLKATKDIWCRDYMPVKTESGKLIQFKYDPSYLKGKYEWEESRSDVKEICRLNGINAQFSDINLDGGNVLICDGRAIISDRVFPENPGYDKDDLVKELSQLLKCEIIIIPAINEDFTGHADGMVRFVDRNTILGNKMADEYKYWQKGMLKVLETYNLKYIDVPFLTDMKDRKYPNSALGIYVNFLEVGNLIVVPEFGRDEDKEVVGILQKAFPDMQIETINYNEVAREGGLLNCTTWVL